MMAGRMRTTAEHDQPPVTRLPDRARWLASLTQAERDILPDLALRDVDARFARWLDADAGGDEAHPR